MMMTCHFKINSQWQSQPNRTTWCIVFGLGGQTRLGRNFVSNLKCERNLIQSTRSKVQPMNLNTRLFFLHQRRTRKKKVIYCSPSNDILGIVEESRKKEREKTKNNWNQSIILHLSVVGQIWTGSLLPLNSLPLLLSSGPWLAATLLLCFCIIYCASWLDSDFGQTHIHFTEHCGFNYGSAFGPQSVSNGRISSLKSVALVL